MIRIQKVMVGSLVLSLLMAGPSVSAVGQTRVTESTILGSHHGAVTVLTFSSDGKQLYSGGKDGLVRSWDVQTKQRQQEFVGLRSDVVSISEDPGSGTIVGINRGAQICSWGPMQETPLKSLAADSYLTVVASATTASLCVLVGFDVHSKYYAIGYSIRDSRKRWESDLPAKPLAVHLSSDGTRGLYVLEDGIATFELTRGEVIEKVSSDGDDVSSGGFFGGPELVHYGLDNQRIVVMNLTTRRSVCEIESDRDWSAYALSRGDGLCVCAVHERPFDKRVGKVEFYALNSGKKAAASPKNVLLVGSGEIMVIAVSPMGGQVACGLKDGRVMLLDYSIDDPQWTEPIDVVQWIKAFVEDHTNSWQRKGEFEKSQEYVDRLKNRDEVIRQFTEQALAELRSKYSRTIPWGAARLGAYDADRETFMVSVPRLPDFVINVPIAQAKALRDNWGKVKWLDQKFIYKDSSWVLNSLVIHEPVSDIRIRYDSQLNMGYDPTTQLSFNFEPVQVEIDQGLVGAHGNDQRQADEYDVDHNLPKSGMSDPDAIAVVIGNAKYQRTGEVSYAVNDAISMKDYLVRIAGFKEGNIFFVPNATKGDFELYFGTRENHRGKLFNATKPDVSQIFVFYSGHGAPSVKDKKGYFVPVECDPNYVELQGYPLDVFYNNLSKIPARSTTVILDACFSGSTILKNVSPVAISIEEPVGLVKNAVVMTSSSGSQVSTWFNQKRHGLFTYFFLKAIHSRNADKNQDGQLTFSEIFRYVADKTEGVPYFSRRLNGVEQDPVLLGDQAERVFVRY